MSIANEKCFNHTQREAVALCLECRRFFCRECVTEHDDRAVCASCLKKLTLTGSDKQSSLAGLISVFSFFAGFIFLWLLFFYFGQVLLRIPASVHEGALWRDTPHESLQGGQETEDIKE